jgi:site-specific DNA-adenine methylase
MRYMGGKARWGHKIVEVIEPWRTPGDPVLEVFCGAANITRCWKPPVIAVDANPALITLWQACQKGWKPPPRWAISKELHAQYKANPNPNDPLTAFLLFGCSFRGVWRGGFTHDTYSEATGVFHDYVAETTRHTLAKIPEIQHVDFRCLDYRQIPRPWPGLVIYCDPPYLGTAKDGIGGRPGDLVPAFDHAEFWAYAEWWALNGALVFVSEEGREMPRGWVPFKSWEMGRTIDKGGSKRTENLFVHWSSPMARKRAA